MKLVCENQQALRKFLLLRDAKQKHFLEECSTDILKAIIEIIINFKQFSTDSLTCTQLNHIAILRRYVYRKSRYNSKLTRKFLIKNIKPVRVLLKFFFESAYTVCLGNIYNT